MHRHRRDPLFASKYHRHSHQGIVNHVSKVLSGKSRGLIAALQQYDVVNVVLMCNATADQINELDALSWIVRRTKPNRVRCSALETARNISLRKISAKRPGTVIASLKLRPSLCFGHPGQLFTSTETWIG